MEYPRIITNPGYEEARHYHSSEDRGFVSILYATGETWKDKNGKPFRPKKQRSFFISELEQYTNDFQGLEDVWVGQNEFRRPNRQLTNLLRLCTSFVDIDFYNVPTLAKLTPDQITQRVFSVLQNAQLPPPNIVVESGRGLQIKWTYKDTLPAQALPRWKAVQSHLVELLSHLGADDKSQDGSRVLRLAGTFHSFNRTIVQTLRCDPTPVDFNQFADSVLPYTRAELAELRQERGEKIRQLREQEKRQKQKKPPRLMIVANNENQFGNLRPKGWGTMNWNRYQDLLKLCRMRGKIQNGKRTMMLTYLLNYMLLSGVTTHHTGLRQEARAMIAEIDSDWEFDDSRLTTLLRKAEARDRGETVTFRDKEWTPLYTPKKQTLIDYFAITPDEEREMLALISSAEKTRRATQRKTEARRAKGVVSRDQYEADALRKNKPWELLGMSRRTWYRRGKPEPERGVAQVCLS